MSVNINIMNVEIIHSLFAELICFIAFYTAIMNLIFIIIFRCIHSLDMHCTYTLYLYLYMP